jgi:NADPH:quinone reductase-like Zn-dependent oxidoreductase
MRCYEIRSPDGVDALALAERDRPQPGPRQVLVRIRASSINYRDLATVEQPAPRGIRYPTIPNSDGAGEVEAVGEAVHGVAVGDRVCGTFFQRWEAGSVTPDAMASALGGARDGVLSEYALLEDGGVVPFPAHLSFEQAATLPCAALTAWNCLVDKGGMRAGDTVLLLGTGGVSVFGLQFAKMFGAQAIVTSSSEAKLERARQLGAWQTVNYRAESEWQDNVLELTDGRGVDIVLEVGGGGTLPRSIAAVRPGGTISLVGVLTGGQIDPTTVMRKSIRLQGIYVGPRQMFQAMNRAIAANGLEPVVDKTFAFDDARDAYHAMRAAGHFGKLVVTV